MLTINERLALDQYFTQELDENYVECRCERLFDPDDGLCITVGGRGFAYCDHCLPDVYLEACDFVYAHLCGKTVSGHYLEWAIKVHEAIFDMV